MTTSRLKKLEDTCHKNPGHTDFILASAFEIQHLPEEMRHNDVFEYIKAVIDLTVRIRVTNTSHGRFCGTPGGENITGSGRVLRVQQGKGRCPISTGRSRMGQWWSLYIITSQLVIYDAHEAKHGMADLFYDDDESCSSGKMLTVKGIGARVKNDWSIMRCVTSDQALVDRLTAQLEVMSRLGSTLELPADGVLIVSHPHARPKRLTWGEKLEEIFEDGMSQLTYTANTCPGCGGAPVMGLGKDGPDQLAVHYGCKDADRNYGATVSIPVAMSLGFGVKG